MKQMTREQAIEFATAKLDTACNEYSFGKPSQDDVERYAKAICEQVRFHHRIMLSVHVDHETGVSFL